MPAVNPQQLQEALIAAASRVAAATGQQPPQIDGACSLESFPAALSAAAGGQQQLLTEEERFNQLLQQVQFISRVQQEAVILSESRSFGHFWRMQFFVPSNFT